MFEKSKLAALVVVILAVGACGRKAAPQQPSPQAPAEPLPTSSAPPQERSSTDDPSAATTATVRASLAEMVFFDYDQSSIRGDARPVLDRKVSILRVNPNVALRIEGHADERGSIEYNLALSLRRANAIRDYLSNYGIDGARFEVTPMGEERPLSMGTSEADYARNRRGEFHITRGGENLVAPR
jgi:peptidoglycan-associated lipoprotein